MPRLIAQLPPGEAAEYLNDRQEHFLAPLSEEERKTVRQACRLLGSCDAMTQAQALTRAADFLEDSRRALTASEPEQLKVRRAMALSAAAVAVILLM